MDNSNWRPTQGVSGGPVGDPSMESGDWRAQLQADSRQRIVNRIMEILKRHLPFSGHEGLQELKKIAVRFEQKIYTAATSQSDYLRKISLKMLTMETKSQNPMPDSMQANSGLNPTDPGNIKLRTSHREYSAGQQYYACPLSKPRKDNGCGYFMWKDAFDEYLRTISSQGSGSAPTECSSCHEKDLRINLLESQKHVLETRVRLLEARLEMARIPDDHACQSDALLRELLGDMENLRM